MNDNKPDRIGLIAGSGDLPLAIALSAETAGTEVYAAGFRKITDPGLKKHVTGLSWLELGGISALIEHFRALGISRIAAAGVIDHRLIFSKVKFDDTAKNILAGAADKRADSILGAFAGILQKYGMELLPTLSLIPENVISRGTLTKNTPDAALLEDIRFGFGIAKGVSGLDIGQTVVVKGRAVIAVEAMEGTDSCILRAGRLAGPGTVVIKVAKPSQDPRFDMPVIGEKTVRSMAKAGSAALAVEAGKAIILDRTAVTERADRKGMVVIGYDGNQEN